MTPLERLVDEARTRGLRPWLVVKERLAARAIEILADSAGDAVLQGGAAVHFVYGSPRLSADVDVAGVRSPDALEAHAGALVSGIADVLGLSARWSSTRAGLLLRAKVTLEVDAARRIVLPIEACAVPARLPVTHPTFGTVEAPEEIIADKIVACGARLASRGSLKLTDIYDLWFLTKRCGASAPALELVVAKAADHGPEARSEGAAAMTRALGPEEVAASLEAVLPPDELALLDMAEVIEVAATLLEAYERAV